MADLNARTAVLAATNPVNGRHNPYATVAQNINLSVIILSRFDLTWVIKDVVDTQRHKELASHILDPPEPRRRTETSCGQ